MVKIKLRLFEGIVICTILPNIGFVLTTLIFIISLFVKQRPIVYIAITVSYCICALLLGLSLIICLIISVKSKKEMVLDNKTFTAFNKIYFYNQIVAAEYYVCKWYTIPIAIFYKQQIAGLIEMRMENGERLKFKVLYRDYLKLKDKIKNIKEK